MIIGIVSQKGGVGKSTLTRLISREYAANKWLVKIADMDSRQGTSTCWNMLRNHRQLEPTIKVEQYRGVKDAVADYNRGDFHLLVLDGAPAASKETLAIAHCSDLLILPTGISLDDLEPTVRLAHELLKNGVERDKIAIVFCRVGDSVAEIADAREYIGIAGYYSIEPVMSERVAYRRAQDGGKSATETTFTSLNNKASAVVKEIAKRAEYVIKGGEQ